MRRSNALLAFTMKYKQGTGLWDEDDIPDVNQRRYNSYRHTMVWYSNNELIRSKYAVLGRRLFSSKHNSAGDNPTGQNAFERELVRQGIEVQKYPLTTTTGASRVREMVILRRRELEQQADKLLKEQREKLRCTVPTEWYDETLGPLNPNFLKYAQSSYDADIATLPQKPQAHSEFLARQPVAKPLPQ